MGLRPVPRAALAQRVHERDEPGHLGAGGHGRAAAARAGHVERGEVVGLHGPVELPPVDRGDHLVLEPEMVQEHRPGQRRGRRRPGRDSLTSESSWRDQHWATRNGPRSPASHRSERGGVDETDPLGQRVDAECRPGQVQEGERRDDRDLDPVVGAQQLDGALGHERRSGHGVDDRLRRRVDRGRDQRLDDAGVHLVEGRGRLVEVVEGGQPRRSRRPPGGGPSAGRPVPAPPPAASAAASPRRSLPAGPRPTTVTWGRRRGTAQPLDGGCGRRRRRRGGSLADGVQHVGRCSGVNGVNTDACTGTHTPYRGSTLTDA